MSLQNNINFQITESMQTQQLLLDEAGEIIEFAAQQIVNALLADKKVLSCGNAASVSSAQYFTSYDDVFAKQLRALGQASDVLLIYSVAGSSLNLVRLVNAAHEKQISVILLVGENETTLPALLHELDVCVIVPSQSEQRIHEAHLLITHCLCDLVDSQLFGNQLV